MPVGRMTAMLYAMPAPVVRDLGDEVTEIRLSELPPPEFLTLAQELAGADPDTSECVRCGARIGHVLEAIAGVADVYEWVTPHLTLDADGKPLAACEGCQEREG